jgi:signal transduction histidine kinase
MKASLVRLPSALRNAIAKKELERAHSENLQSVREEERTKIAREIHDELGQTLTALRMDIAWLEGRVSRSKKNVRDKIRSIDEIVGSTIHQVQRIAAGLRPPILDDLGFRAAAEWQAQEFERRSGIRCNFVAGSEEIILDEQRSTALYRIFQEAMTNVSRHAQATTIEIQLDTDEKDVIMTIKDNGKGITQSEIERIRSLGILGMRERAFLVGGEVCITGVHFQGTQVRVKIPRSVEATEKHPFCKSG